MKKSVKKILSMVLVLCMTISIVAIPASATPNAPALIQKVGNAINIDFNYDNDISFASGSISKSDGSYSDSTDWANYFQIMNSFIGTEQQPYVNAADKYLVIGNDATASNRGRFQICDWRSDITKITNGRYITEFKFNLPTLATHKYLFRASNNGGIGVEVGVVTSGSNHVLKAGTTTTTFALTAGNWYNAKLDVDINTTKYDMYVDGVLIAKDIAFSLDFNEATPTSGVVFNRLFEFDSYSKGLVYIDDFRIYKEPTGVITYAADDFSNYGEDVVYDNSSYIPSFAGLYTGRSDRQTGFTIDHTNGYVTTTGGGNMQIEAGKYGSDYKQNSYAAEFKLTPKASHVGEIFQIADKYATHTGIKFAFHHGRILLLHGFKDINLSTNNSWDMAQTEVGTFATDTTYKVKVVVDTNRTYTQTVTAKDGTKTTYNRPGVCDVYVNDILVATGVPFGYNVAQSGNTIPGLQLYLKSSGSAIFDDLRLYSDEREEVIARLNADMAAQSQNGVVSTEIINLPSTYTVASGNVYNVVWTSSSDVINAQTGKVNLVKGGNATLTAKVFYTGEEAYALTSTYALTVKSYKVDTFTRNAYDIDFDYNEDIDLSGSVVISKADGSHTTGTTDWINYLQISNSFIGTEQSPYVNAEDKYLVLGSDGTYDSKNQGRFMLCDWQAAGYGITKGRYVTEFKFNLPTLAQHKYLFRAHDNGPGVEVGIGVKDTDYVLLAGETVTNFALSADKWYKAKVDIDILNWKYDLYINGVLVADDIAFTLDFKSAAKTDINAFQRVFDFQTYQKGLVYIDDMSIYKQSVSVEKYSDISANLYAAVYDAQGDLVSCTVVNDVATGTYLIDVNAVEGTKVVFFVWANDGSLKPMMLPYEVK